MMKNRKFLILCACLLAASMSITACSMGNNKDNGATEAPYEDETNKDVNDARNGTVGGDLKDAGRNLMDSIKDTGDAVRDGIDNLGEDAREDTRTNP